MGRLKEIWKERTKEGKNKLKEEEERRRNEMKEEETMKNRIENERMAEKEGRG
jgi:hypothetical protein